MDVLHREYIQMALGNLLTIITQVSDLEISADGQPFAQRK